MGETTYSQSHETWKKIEVHKPKAETKQEGPKKFGVPDKKTVLL